MDKAPLEIDFSRGTLCITIVIALVAIWVIIANNKEK